MKRLISRKTGNIFKIPISVILGLMLFCNFNGAYAQPITRNVVFLSGPEGGVYHLIGEKLKGYKGLKGLSFKNQESDGSLANLKDLVNSQDARFALTQEDVLVKFVNEYKIQHANKEPEISVVSAIFYDYLHILTRISLNISCTKDYWGKKIYLGGKQSGSRVTAESFLGLEGLGQGNFTDVAKDAGYNESDVIAMLGSNKLDIAMLVTVPGAPDIRKILCSGNAHLTCLGYNTLRALTLESLVLKTRSQTMVTRIHRGTYYCGNDGNGKKAVLLPTKDVPTIGVPVLLVTNTQFDREHHNDVLNIWKAVATYAWPEAWKAMSEQKIDTNRPLYTVPAPILVDDNKWSLHKSGFRAIRSKGYTQTGTDIRKKLKHDFATITKENNLPGSNYFGPDYLLDVLFVLMFVIILFVLHLVTVRTPRLRRSRKIIFAIWTMTTIILVSMIGVYLTERRFNPNFSNLWETLWSVVIYLFSGLEDRTPYSPLGRLFVGIILMMGPAVLAVVTGMLASGFVINFMEGKMPGKLKEHFLILNWNERAMFIIKQLKNNALKMESTIVVVSDDPNMNFKKIGQQQQGMIAKTGDNFDIFEDVYFSPGDATDERVLKNVNVQDAHSILILADSRKENGVDERSLQLLFSVQSALRNLGKTDAHVVVELMDMRNLVIIDGLKENFPGKLDAVAAGYARTRLLSQAAVHEGVIDFFNDILNISEDTNEIYMLDLPGTAIRKTFTEYAVQVLSSKQRETLIPVGVLSKDERGLTKVYTNPRPDSTGYILKKGDKLIVLAYTAPSDGVLPE